MGKDTLVRFHSDRELHKTKTVMVVSSETWLRTGEKRGVKIYRGLPPMLHGP